MVTFVVDLLAVKLVSICTVHATVAVLQLPIVKVIFILFFIFYNLLNFIP